MIKSKRLLLEKGCLTKLKDGEIKTIEKKLSLLLDLA